MVDISIVNGIINQLITGGHHLAGNENDSIFLELQTCFDSPEDEQQAGVQVSTTTNIQHHQVEG